MFKKLLTTTLSKAGRTSDQSNTYQSQFEVYRVSLVIWIPDTSFPLLMHSVIQSCPQDLVDFDACTHKKHSCCSGASDAGFDQEASSYCAGTCLCTIIYGEERGFQGPDRCVRLARGTLESAEAALLLEWAVTHRCVFSVTQSPHKHEPKKHLFNKNTRLQSEAQQVLRVRTV